MAAGRPLPTLDMSKYEAPEPPANRQKNVGEWREAVANAEAQLEQQEVRLMNLELLNKYAANVWVRHNATAEATKQRTQLALNAYREEITKVNQQRKDEQLSAGKSLHHLKMQWYELVAKNRLIEADCARLEGLLKEKKEREASEGGQQEASAPQGSDEPLESEGDGDVEMGEAEEEETEKHASADSSSTTAASAEQQSTEGEGEVEMREAEDAAPAVEEEEETAAEESVENAEKEAEIRAFVKGLLVKHLKDELKKRSLPTSGKKADLAARLLETMLAELN